KDNSEFDRNLDDEDGFVPKSDEFDELPESVDDIPNIDAQIDADLETLETIGEQVEESDQSEEVFDIETVIPKGQTLEDAIIARCNTLADAGGLSAAEYRKYLEMAGTYKNIEAPNGQT